MTPQLRHTGHPSPEELAALLDGEVTNYAELERLNAALEQDSGLKAEYDAQREVKLLLSQVEATYAAPDFMHTRVLGAISAKRRERRGFALPAWGAAFGAVMLFALGFGVATQVPVGAGGDAALMQANTAYPPGLFQASSTDMFEEVYFKDYESPQLSAEDAWLGNFIELSQQAHKFSKTYRLTNGVVSPDMSSAVMVVNPAPVNGQ